MDDPTPLLTAADRLTALAERTPPGDWRAGGLLATRPEVIAHSADGSQHVAEARAGTAAWIVALSPAVADPLAALLRAVAEGAPSAEAATQLARALLAKLP